MPTNRILNWSQDISKDSELVGTHCYFWWLYVSGKLPRMNGEIKEDATEMVKQLRRAQVMRRAIIDSILDCEGK